LKKTPASNSHMSQDDVVPVDALDEEEERFQAELQRAIEASKAGTDAHRGPAQVPKPTNTSESQASQSGTSTPSGSVPFLSERAQLEKERLERLKRLRNESDDREAGLEKSQPPPFKRQHLSSAHERNRRINQFPSTISSSSSCASLEEKPKGKTSNVTTPVMGQLFWDGELRPTANRHSQPREDGRATFRLIEILGSVRARFLRSNLGRIFIH
jgi:tyrosyl-DNA phosphodiesterase-1